MELKENIRRILKEESLKQTLMHEIMKSGIRDTAKLMSVDVKELLEMVGMTGTKEDTAFLIKSIMENEFKEQVKYCSYNIVPGLYSNTLYVFLPKPLANVWTLDEMVRYRAEELIGQLLYKLGGDLISGYNIYVYNTGDC